MKYTSLFYLTLFLPLTLLAYQLCPQRHRWVVLLTASYFFYFMASLTLILYLWASTLCVYAVGLGMGRCDPLTHGRKRLLVWIGVGVHLALLAVLKYGPFIAGVANDVLALWPAAPHLPVFKLAVPAGLSFFSLQAISYLADIYQGRTKADTNLGRVALYMAFFPTIIEGPICRYEPTAAALYAGQPLNHHDIAYGSQLLCWGLFKKMVIADRLSPLVNNLFKNPAESGGVLAVLAAVACTIQLYADFSGCIDISIGTAQMFGITLPQNFRQPFFSTTVTEFWRRWHITLGTWLKDYIFFPLSMSPRIKALGRRAKQRHGRRFGQIIQAIIPLLAVWMANGIWHGAGWNYLFFGAYYFVLVMLGLIFEQPLETLAARLHIDRKAWPWRALQMVKMAVIVLVGELMFRASDVASGLAMLRSIFTGWDWKMLTDGTLLQHGIYGNDYMVLLAAGVIMLAVDICHEAGISLRDWAARLRLPIRWTLYVTLILLVVIFGAYGEGYQPVDPLYANF